MEAKNEAAPKRRFVYCFRAGVDGHLCVACVFRVELCARTLDNQMVGAPGFADHGGGMGGFSMFVRILL